MAPAGSRLLILALVYVTISSVRGQGEYSERPSQATNRTGSRRLHINFNCRACVFFIFVSWPSTELYLSFKYSYTTITCAENDDTYSCSESENIERAEVGKGLTLECDGRPFITITCPAFQWFRVRENTNDSLSGNTSSYTVSQNVPAVEDVGGHLYGCQCPQAGSAGNTPCKLFRIWGEV